jgi:hypothetical protein
VSGQPSGNVIVNIAGRILRLSVDKVKDYLWKPSRKRVHKILIGSGERLGAWHHVMNGFLLLGKMLLNPKGSTSCLEIFLCFVANPVRNASCSSPEAYWPRICRQGGDSGLFGTRKLSKFGREDSTHTIHCKGPTE